MAAEHVLAARDGREQCAMRSASCSISALAPARWAPMPARIKGLRLWRSNAAAASIAWARGAAGGRGRAGAGGGGAFSIELGQLDIDRQQQGGRAALQRCVRGIRKRAAGGLRARCDEGTDAGGAQHAGGVEALVVRTELLTAPGEAACSPKMIRTRDPDRLA